MSESIFGKASSDEHIKCGRFVGKTPDELKIWSYILRGQVHQDG